MPPTHAASECFSGPETASAPAPKAKDPTPHRESLPDIAESSASHAASAAVPESAAKAQHQQPVKSEGMKDEGPTKVAAVAAALPRSTAHPAAPKEAVVKDLPHPSHNPVSRV